MRKMLLPATAVLLAVAALAHADVINVDCQGTADYETIQEGINAADPGDTVLVWAGGYFGDGNRNLYFNGKQVVLTSVGGRRATTINADSIDRVFNLIPSDGPDTVIEGFTIMNGTHSYGGGIYCNGASVTVRDCIITSCTATQSSYGGGGVFVGGGGSPTFIDVTISACDGFYGGGLLSVQSSTPTLTRVAFLGNTSYERGAGAFIENVGGSFSITDCVFDNNNCTGHDGGGLFLSNASPAVTGCTFVRNRGATAGHVMLNQDSDPLVENCIFAFTTSGPAVFRWNEEQSPTFTRCIVYGNDDGDDLVGTISDTLVRDPRFCDVLHGDVTLCSNSPCLPANNGWGVLLGAFGSGCGDCDTPVEDATWGRLKALYR